MTIQKITNQKMTNQETNNQETNNQETNNQETNNQLYIDPSGGMAGDMFSAALISAGADFNIMQKAMTKAGEKLGKVSIQHHLTNDGSSQLTIQLQCQYHHLGAHQAWHILDDLFRDLHIQEQYRQTGMAILDILVKAEKKAHAEFNIVIEDDHHSHHHHDESPGHDHSHQHSHSHGHEESFLHEAQDIVIDIMGAITGMQLLNIEPHVKLLAPVSVGGGHVHCSHGTLSIPAPATTVILRESGIPWQKGPIDIELLTPTGAAILAGLHAQLIHHHHEWEPKSSGKARGGKILPIPPLQTFLFSHELQ